MPRLLIVCSFFLTIMSFSTSAYANNSAQLLLDARTGEVLAAENPDALRHPASLTKMMTVYMVLDAIHSRRLKWDSPVPFSKHASSRPPTKLGVKTGDEITVKEAVLSLIVRSANDSSAALAEKLGGTEENFAAMMTRQARRLGMMSTTFFNASGLPHPQQFTTARDMSTLAIALMRDYPDDYELFSTRSFTFRGRSINGHNNLMYRYKGMDGIKTGYTNASGFNLVSAVEKDGRRVVGVVMGGRTAASRDRIMEKLIDANIGKAESGDLLMASRSVSAQVDLARLGDDVPVPPSRSDAMAAINRITGANGNAELHTATAYANPALTTGTIDNARPRPKFETSVEPMNRWQVQIAAANSAEAAMLLLADARSKIGGPLAELDTYAEMVTRNGVTFFRARFTGFETKEDARKACDLLVAKRYDCVLTPARS